MFDVYVSDRKSRTALRIYTGPHAAFATAWSPDAEKLLVQVAYSPYDADLYSVDLRTDNPRLQTPHVEQANFDSSQFTPDMRGAPVKPLRPKQRSQLIFSDCFSYAQSA